MLVTAAIALVLALSVGLIVALPSGGPGTSGRTGQAAAPAAVDVSAARACAAFTTYLDDASNGEVPQSAGQALARAAGQLLAGAPAAQQAGRALPKWTALGEQLVAAGDDIVNRDNAALQKDGPAAAQTCHTIPAAARQAGGYTTGG